MRQAYVNSPEALSVSSMSRDRMSEAPRPGQLRRQPNPAHARTGTVKKLAKANHALTAMHADAVADIIAGLSPETRRSE